MNTDEKIEAIYGLVDEEVLSENEAALCANALKSHVKGLSINAPSVLKNNTLLYENNDIKIYFDRLEIVDDEWMDRYFKRIWIYFKIQNMSLSDVHLEMSIDDLTINGIGFGDRPSCYWDSFTIHKKAKREDTIYLSEETLAKQDIYYKTKINSINFNISISLDEDGEYIDLNNGNAYKLEI